METEAQSMNSFSLFEHIESRDIPKVLTCLGAWEKSYAKGQYLSFTGDRAQAAGLILEGCIHMTKEDLWGNTSIFAVLSPGDLFGESFICSHSFAATVSFYAAADSRVLLLPLKRLLRSCASSCEFHHRLIENLMAIMAEKNVQFIEKMEIISKKTIRDKVLAYLALLAQKSGTSRISSPLSRQELADYLCVDRSALSRELSAMKKDGLIDFSRSDYTVF
ncbi:Crp/Fnr family transcriptional regulator [Treponema sp. OttesenSCG-928-L16]|nr:Crp/Fnr family transcriptional regulator [Treponema sp. OttesenSCG-928-L16]